VPRTQPSDAPLRGAAHHPSVRAPVYRGPESGPSWPRPPKSRRSPARGTAGPPSRIRSVHPTPRALNIGVLAYESLRAYLRVLLAEASGRLAARGGGVVRLAGSSDDHHRYHLSARQTHRSAAVRTPQRRLPTPRPRPIASPSG